MFTNLHFSGKSFLRNENSLPFPFTYFFSFLNTLGIYRHISGDCYKRTIHDNWSVPFCQMFAKLKKNTNLMRFVNQKLKPIWSKTLGIVNCTICSDLKMRILMSTSMLTANANYLNGWVRSKLFIAKKIIKIIWRKRLIQ